MSERMRPNPAPVDSDFMPKWATHAHAERARIRRSLRLLRVGRRPVPAESMVQDDWSDRDRGRLPSGRDLEVMEFLRRGQTMREIATHYAISVTRVGQICHFVSRFQNGERP